MESEEYGETAIKGNKTFSDKSDTSSVSLGQMGKSLEQKEGHILIYFSFHRHPLLLLNRQN